MIPAHRQLQRAGEAYIAEGEREVRELPRLVLPGTTVVDVGAHIGNYTYAIAETFDFLISHNYRIEFLNPAGNRRPFAAFDTALNERLIDSEGMPLPGYVSNFIFVPIG